MLLWLALAMFTATGGQTPAATISGTVRMADASTPADGLVVVLMPQGAAPRASSVPAVRRTDVASGRFDFGALPLGRYRVIVADASALTDWPDPALLDRLNNSSSMVLPQMDGSLMLDLTIGAEAGIRRITDGKLSGSGLMIVPSSGRGAGRPLPPGTPRPPAGTGSIAGRLTVDDAPVAGVTVLALRWITRNGRQEPVTSGERASTDETGAFRVTGLRAGEYLIAAFPDGVGRDAATAMRGRRETDRHLPAPVARPDGTASAFTTTFYPGVTSPADAGVIVLGNGDAKASLELRMARTNAATVSGSARGPGGAPIAADGAVLRPADPVDQMGGANVRYAPLSADGRFRFGAVPFGEYDVLLLAARTPIRERRVRVGAEPLTDIVLEFDPPITISGRVRFDGPDPPPASFAGVVVTLAEAELRVGATRTARPVNADGTFSIPVPAGRTYRIGAEGQQPWSIVFGLIGDQDTLDVPIALTESRNDAVVVLASRDTSISGSVRTADGQPLLDGTIVIFPARRELRHAGSRYLRVMPLAGAGLFNASLPPGDYFAIAGPDIAPEGRIRIADLTTLERDATKFTLEIGAQKRLVLTSQGR
jgi:hypothetical protein